METLVQRLEQAVIRVEQVSVNLQVSNGMANGECNGINGGQSQCMEAFDLLLMGPLSEYLKNSRAIGEDVEKHAEMVNNALQLQRSFLKMAITHQEPAQMELADLLKPISDKIQEIQNFREHNRGSNQFNHLSAVSESIPALGWVAVSQKPVPYVKEMNDAAIFYTNRVLKDYKDLDKRHVEWVRSYLSIWTELQAFIKQYHTTGLVWSKTGPIAPPSLFAPAPGGPCPPPPPPPPGLPPVFTGEPPKADSTTAQHSALFTQLNQGEAITKGTLKHISKDQMTHKNPALRSQGGGHHASPPKSRNPGGSSNKAPPQKQPPLLELEGKKWRVVRYLLSCLACQASNLFYYLHSGLGRLLSKCNPLVTYNCKKLGLVFDNVVGIVEVINSKDIQLQVMGRVPTISINKTEGCQVYLSKDALDCEIISAKSSEMNILVPQDDDYREFPVPEQFKTVWEGSKLVTEPTEIAG
uniref:Cyclase associated actin cytoskeleton regulatory protein 2 n=1 Tax=Hucho hucho TaxID=62062 RepID=A0A4W5LLF7_9TELE